MTHEVASALAAWPRADLSPSAKVLLLAVACATGPDGLCRLPRHALAQATGLAGAQLSLALEELASVGLLQRAARGLRVAQVTHSLPVDHVDNRPGGLQTCPAPVDIRPGHGCSHDAASGDLSQQSTGSTGPTTTNSHSNSNYQLQTTTYVARTRTRGEAAALAAAARMRLQEAEQLVDRVASRLGWLLTRTRRASQVRAALELLDAGLSPEEVERLACQPGVEIRSLWALHGQLRALPGGPSSEAVERARRILSSIRR